ncbi:MAG: methyltransferase domain-containing protein [Gammaproteobacteria bacterium]|nr:methyltransferase domain-containing protein [Gammaproteobacteria bacterium]MBU1656288.1 methyltransferase domain-containing protein [Gammaproteobacteria bacterium]MBU1959853.1 methyltransferase domain-containing protein [Gammaproteobacteria bacterium]
MRQRSFLGLLKSNFRRRGAESAVRWHRAQYLEQRASAADDQGREAGRLSRNYYDLVTDLYEYGWGEKFHFGVRRRGEGLESSLVRHELRLAEGLGLKPGMQVLDLGCGIGGPMRNIARATGARVLGVNINGYQVRRARELNRAAGLEGETGLIECDWMQLPLAAETIDAAYAIEATCHAGDRGALFRQIHRVLKRRAYIMGYEWCLTENYDPYNPLHCRDRAGIEEGSGLPSLTTRQDIEQAIRGNGFELIECRDLAPECDPETPWYLPLKGDGFSSQALKRSHLGGIALQGMVAALEHTRILPHGAGAVVRLLRLCGDSLVRAGEAGTFTPLLFFHARKRDGDFNGD